MRTYKGVITNLPTNGIFVFGSNTQGRHGKGAALIAKTKFGAKYGQASGLQGRSYAIITKDLTKKVHPSISEKEIKWQILQLYHAAEDNPTLDYYVAYSGEGTNLNFYTPQDMADMFNSFKNVGGIPENIIFEEKFSKLIKT